MSRAVIAAELVTFNGDKLIGGGLTGRTLCGIEMIGQRIPGEGHRLRGLQLHLRGSRGAHREEESGNLDVLSLRYVGRINFWNADDSGSRLIVVLRKGLSLAVRLLVNGVVSRLLPPHKKTHAPWIVFVAREV